MIKSMTGFGRSISGRNHRKVQVEIRSVNSRFLDMKIRGFSLEPEVEIALRERVTTSLIRGNIQVIIEAMNGNGGERSLIFNRERFEAIDTILQSIQMEYGRHMELSEIISSGDLFSPADGQEIEAETIFKAMDAALKQVVDMRTREGKKLHQDLEGRIQTLRSLLSQIILAYDEQKESLRRKYLDRIQELMKNVTLDENRMNQEIAILADKMDITEELVRFESHLDQFLSFLELEEPVGKRLNFLCQELSREVNTIGSKSAQTQITNLVVEMKDELEKIREQVQNIV